LECTGNFYRQAENRISRIVEKSTDYHQSDYFNRSGNRRRRLLFHTVNTILEILHFMCKPRASVSVNNPSDNPRRTLRFSRADSSTGISSRLFTPPRRNIIFQNRYESFPMISKSNARFTNASGLMPNSSATSSNSAFFIRLRFTPRRLNKISFGARNAPAKRKAMSSFSVSSRREDRFKNDNRCRYLLRSHSRYALI